MSKLKDIPFGSEIPTFDNSGYITLSSGLKGPSGSAIIEMRSGSAVFIGEACYASYATCAGIADTACCAYCASSADSACYACYATCAGDANFAYCAISADDASYACFASEACYALQLSYCGGSYLSPSYCVSLSAYLLV